MKRQKQGCPPPPQKTEPSLWPFSYLFEISLFKFLLICFQFLMWKLATVSRHLPGSCPPFLVRPSVSKALRPEGRHERRAGGGEGAMPSPFSNCALSVLYWAHESANSSGVGCGVILEVAFSHIPSGHLPTANYLELESFKVRGSYKRDKGLHSANHVDKHCH